MALIEKTSSGWKTRLAAIIAAALLLLWLGAFVCRHRLFAWPVWWLESGLIAMFTVLGWRRWRLAVDVAILALPLCIMLPMRLGLPNYSVVEIALLATALGGALRVARTGQFRRPVTALTWLMGLMAAVALISSAFYFIRFYDVFNGVFPRVLLDRLALAFQMDKDRGWEFYPLRAALTLIEGFVFFHVIAARVRDFRDVRHLIQVSLLSVMLVAVFGTAQYYQIGGCNWNRVPFAAWHHRINSTFPDVNSLASFLVAGFFLLIPLLTLERRWKPRGMAWWILPVLCVSLWMAHSRIAFGALALTLPLFAFLLNRRYALEKPIVRLYQKRGFLLLIFVLLMLMLGFAVMGSDRLCHTDLQWTRSSGVVAQALKGRLNIWRSALYNMAEAPWLGSGVGTFYKALPVHREPDVPAGDWNWNPYFENAHNQFIQMFTETGVVGGGLFLLIVLLLLFQGLRAIVIHRNGERAILAGVLCGIVAFLLTCLTGHPLLLVDVNLWFWFLAALLFARHSSESAEFVAAQTRWRAIQSLALAAIVVAAAGRLGTENRPPPPRLIGYGIHDLEVEGVEGGHSVFRWLEKRAVCRLYQARPDLEFSLRNVFGTTRPVAVIVRVNGREIDRLTLGDHLWRLCSYRLPDSTGKMIRIEILADFEQTTPDDPRRLSIQIQSLEENSWI